MHERIRRPLILVLVLTGLVWIYRESFLAMASKWWDDAAFAYGFVIAPISLWLAWQRRPWLTGVSMAASWFGVAVMFALALLWIVARGTGILVLEQLLVVGMIPAIVLTVVGPRATRVLAFPLAFLLFMVPFGRAVVPWLMQATADVATLALQWSGIPVFRSHMYITIPGGSFEVARACSGIAFLMTALVLGVLYGYLNYVGWKKRMLCVLASVGVPILANGIRVYLTIAVSHLTDMRFGPGAEHVTFAQVFFILVMLGMFWLGRRWQDEQPVPPPVGVPGAISNDGRLRDWVPVSFAVALMSVAPLYQATAAARFRAMSMDASGAVQLPQGLHGWQGPVHPEHGWRPLYRNGLVERSGTYRNANGAKVDAFVAVYGLGATAGVEMIAYENVLYAQEHASLARVQRRRIDLGDGTTLNVRELVVPDADGEQLVWHWFVLGERRSTSPYVIKALEAMTWVTRGAAIERVVTVATPADPTARERLQSFLSANPQCIASGFSTEACGG